jgi:putative molybdopterin biosynthesis protein
MSSADDHDTTAVPRVENRLAAIRRQRAIPAAELARRAGVSRQTIYAIEAGDFVPNTAVALKLAHALEVSVEELFHLAMEETRPARTVDAVLVDTGDCFPGNPVELCRVDDRLVSVPITPAPHQLVPADGMLVNPARSTVELLNERFDESRLLIAGCDPATSVLARHLERAGVRLVTASVNSTVALGLLRKRLVHVAGTHLGGAGKKAAHPAGTAVIAFALWEEGMVLARGNPKKLAGIEDLIRPRVNLVNRETGSGSRRLLDARLQSLGIRAQQVRGYNLAPAAGHLAAAWQVSTGLADCCIATRSAARAFGLDFIPLASERYDLIIHRDHLQLAAVERLLDMLTQTALRHELETLCGYDTRETGRRMA